MQIAVIEEQKKAAVKKAEDEADTSETDQSMKPNSNEVLKEETQVMLLNSDQLCISQKYKYISFEYMVLCYGELVKCYKYEILTQTHSMEFIKLDSGFWIHLFIR
jgi:hypothetical protein